MRTLLLTNGSPNQMALAHRMAQAVDLVGVVVSRNIPKKARKRQLRGAWASLAARTVGRPLVNAWVEMLRRCQARYPEFPNVPRTDVGNVNDDATLAAIDSLKVDLIVVSGTNLVGKRIIAAGAERKGVINLHTGISPYVKGGPNCTNWCLSTGDFHLIGNSVMWLDSGIDTGALIATEQTPLSGRESLDELQDRVMNHAHDVYVRAQVLLSEGKSVPRVPQAQLGEGHTYNNADWNVRAITRALRHFHSDYSPQTLERLKRQHASTLKLVSLTGAATL